MESAASSPPGKFFHKNGDGEEFQKPHAWDIGKRFTRIRDSAEIRDLRIRDPRHFAATMLFIEGVSDAIVRKMTGHRSDELENLRATGKLSMIWSVSGAVF